MDFRFVLLSLDTVSVMPSSDTHSVSSYSDAVMSS